MNASLIFINTGKAGKYTWTDMLVVNQAAAIANIFRFKVHFTLAIIINTL